jgi:Golgi apyrase
VRLIIKDFRNHQFVGVSEYWYSSQDIFHLGGEYTYQTFYEAAREFCAKDWPTIQSEFKSGKYPLVENTRRLHSQCFKSSWMISLLHEGYGVPQNGSGTFQSVNEIGIFSVSWTLGIFVGLIE